MFAAQGSSDSLPAAVRDVQAQIRPEREAAVRAERNQPDVTDQLFSHQELVMAQNLCDTAAGSDEVTYSMLAHAGPSGEAVVLVLVNCSWLAGCLSLL